MNQIGVDVGGTFTDVFLVRDGDFTVHKVPSTPEDPSIATVDGMKEACGSASLSLGDLDLVFHGTTVATNTVLQRSGARVGLLTTEGFRDILHIARHKKPFNFSIAQQLPWQRDPLVRRRLRLPVPERVVAPSGEILLPLDEAAVRAALTQLRTDGVEAVAVCFLHSYLNPTNEARAAELIAEELPDAFVSLRHVVCPEYREYESFNTTVLNAYLGPVTGRYLERLGSRLEEAHHAGDVLFMTSTGGVEARRTVTTTPVNMVLSGPVAGVMGGLAAGRQVGHEDLITLDVGGTSADIGLVNDGQLRHKHWLDNTIGGLQLRLSMVDVSTIGAGGGSIAYVDEGGLLQVGPRSAGADPGPACYGRGGTDATVTDAQNVLGRLSEESFLGGRMSVSRALAEGAVRERVAARLGLDLSQAAAGVVKIATAHMVSAIELISVRRGFDPRDFTLVAFGGAGALFASDIARELAIPRILVPRFPGVAAAMGLLASDVVHSYSQTLVARLDELDAHNLAGSFAELEARAREQLDHDRFRPDDTMIERFAECRYVGQGYEIRVPAPAGLIDDVWRERLRETFHAAHAQQYGNAFSDRDLVVVNVGARGVGLLPELPALRLSAATSPCAPRTSRPVWFEESGAAIDARVFAREALRAGHVIEGPAVIEQEDSTTVVPPGMRAEAHVTGHLLLTSAAAEGTA